MSSSGYVRAVRTHTEEKALRLFWRKTSLEEAIDLIKQNSRRYAKRQLTWFKRDEDIQWFEPNELNFILQQIKKSGIST